MKEVLKKVATGEISTKDIERARLLRAIGFEEELQAGFLGFMDGTVLKVTPERYEYMIALAGILNPEDYLFYLGGKFGPEKSVMKILK